jgi:hypothetical protein
MTDPRMHPRFARRPFLGRHTGAGREEIFSKPAATFSKPAATKSKPGTTKSKLDATKSKWLFLPRFEPFQRFMQMFPARQ